MSSNANATTTKQLPRDALVMHSLLKEVGVTAYEPKVIHQMLEYVYRYVTSIVEEARVYSTYAKKKSIDAEDVKLVIKLVTEKSWCSVPPRNMLMELAKAKNSLPLPLLKSGSGLRLPPDRFCLTQPNYQLNFYKRAIASSSSQPATTSVKLPGSHGVFKTPAPRPLHNRDSYAGNLPPPISVQFSPAATGSTPTIRVMPGVMQQHGQGVKRKMSED